MEDKPLWSFAINQLDGEVWQRTDEGPEVGLGVSLVEAKPEGDLYLVGAALWDPKKRPENTAARLSLFSAGGQASVLLSQPNSPRSTPDRTVYEARALVASGQCHQLRVDFETLDRHAELSFPTACRHRRAGHALWGMLGLMLLLAAGLVIGRQH